MLPYEARCTELEHVNFFLNWFQHTDCCGSDPCAVLLSTPAAGKGNVQEGIHLSNTISGHTDRYSYVAV